jgi:hypothetical protein
VLLLACSACGTAAAGRRAAVPASSASEAALPQGAWLDPADAAFGLLIENRTLWFFQHGDLQRAAQAFLTDGGWMACAQGRERPLELATSGEAPALRDPWQGELRRLEKAAGVDWEPAPLALPPAMPLSMDEVERIQGEIWQRRREDLDALGPLEMVDPAEAWRLPPPERGVWNPAWVANVTANRKFLRQLVARVGWIDAERFGYATAFEAGLLLLHCKDPRLLMAALPVIERDVAAERLLGDAYALTYDKLQILLGKKQRFGTQVDYDAQGHPFALPTESPERIDERREQLGLSPLSQYFAVLGGTEVRFSTECAGLDQ